MYILESNRSPDPKRYLNPDMSALLYVSLEVTVRLNPIDLDPV